MWKLIYSKKAAKQYAKLPMRVQTALDTLVHEIEATGPVRGNWSHYGKLDDKTHHCHLKDGHPTYVAVWEEIEDKIQLVRITYAGTHENAPY